MLEEQKEVRKMSKKELQVELDLLRVNYNRLVMKYEIMKTIDKMVFTTDLQSIQDYVNEVYQKSMIEKWGLLYATRDNIHNMADNLVNLYDAEKLGQFHNFMYYALLDSEPQATEGLHKITDNQ